MGHARRGVCKGKVSVDSGGEFGMQILCWGLLVLCKDDFTGKGGEVRKGHRYKEVSRERERERGSPGTHCAVNPHSDMDYRQKGGRLQRNRRGGSLLKSGRKSVGLPTLAGGKAGIWGTTEALVWVIGLSEQTCQCTDCKVVLFPRLSRGASMCVCVYVSWRPLKSLPIAS